MAASEPPSRAAREAPLSREDTEVFLSMKEQVRTLQAERERSLANLKNAVDTVEDLQSEVRR